MPLRESESIILKSYNLAEADRIVVLFTKEFGMVRAVAKGARRLKSKFGSALEPFSEVKVEFFEKEERELVSLQNADLLRSSFYVAAQPDSLETFSYIADLLLTFAPPHDPNEKLYRMLRAVLSAAFEEQIDHKTLKLYSEIWVLRLGGFLPDWTICGSCRKAFGGADSAILSEGSQLICGYCAQGMRPGPAVSPAHRKVIADALGLPPNDFITEKRPLGDIVGEVSRIIERIIEAASGRPLSKAKETS